MFFLVRPERILCCGTDNTASSYYRGCPGEEVLSNHSLRPTDSCLRLLDPDEEPKYPDYKVEQSVADEVAAVIAGRENPPICKICYNLTKDNSRSKSLYLLKDVNVLAHHMKTKCVQPIVSDESAG